MNYVMKSILTLVTGILLSLSAQATTYKEGFFTQILNHEDPTDHRVFKQRYFIEASSSLKSDAPVLYFIGNEAELGMLLKNTALLDMAHKLNAHFIALEHRYYGKSQPFELITTQNLQYLSFENALKDLARFEKYMRDNKGLRGKWFVVGKSYGANLAAFYRQKYPDLVVGALASSPGLHSVSVWPEYDRHAAKMLGSKCLTSFRTKIIAPLEGALNDAERMRKFKALFDAADIDENADFLYQIEAQTAFMISMNGPDKICQALQSNAAMTTFSKQFTAFMRGFNARLVDFSDQGITDVHASLYRKGIGLRQWQYQCCTEFGGLIVHNQDNSQSLGSRMTANVPLKSCKHVFNILGLPQVEKTNSNYYFPLLNPKTTNILVVNGSNDPVTTLSISHENGNDTNPNILVHTIVGGAHHSELEAEKPTDLPSVKDAREIEIKTISTWLRGTGKNVARY